MKKTFVKAMAMALALVTVICLLASCGTKLSGTYEAKALGTGASFTFKGSSVTIKLSVIGFSGDGVEGKYEIKDDQITFTFESDDSSVKEYNGTFDFEKGEDYIKIGVVKYTKVD